MSVNWSAIENVFRAAVINSSGYNPGKVIFAFENNRPTLPYVEINMDAGYFVKGAFDQRTNLPDGSVKIQGLRNILISVHGFGPGAVRTLKSVMDSFHSPGVYQAFHNLNISFQNRGDQVRNLTNVQENKYIEYGQMDVMLQVSTESIIFEPGYFDKVRITSADLTPVTPNLPESIIELTNKKDTVRDINTFSVELENQRDTVTDTPESVINLENLRTGIEANSSYIVELENSRETEATSPEDIVNLENERSKSTINTQAEVVESTIEINSGSDTDFQGSSQVPNPPQNLNVISVSANNVEIGWDASLFGIGYLIDISSDNFNTYHSIYHDHYTKFLSITTLNLAYSSDYQIRIRAFNEIGTSDYSDTLLFSTDSALPGLVAWLPLTDGTTNDYSDNEYNGTLSGTANVDNDYLDVTTVTGNYLSIPPEIFNNLGAGDFTICWWQNVIADGVGDGNSTCPSFSVKNPTYNEHFAYEWRRSSLFWGLDYSGYSKQMGYLNHDSWYGSWIFYLIERTGNTLNFYRNNALYHPGTHVVSGGPANLSSFSFNNCELVQIGNTLQAITQTARSYFRHFQVYNRVLTSDEKNTAKNLTL